MQEFAARHDHSDVAWLAPHAKQEHVAQLLRRHLVPSSDYLAANQRADLLDIVGVRVRRLRRHLAAEDLAMHEVYHPPAIKAGAIAAQRLERQPDIIRAPRRLLAALERTDYVMRGVHWFITNTPGSVNGLTESPGNPSASMSSKPSTPVTYGVALHVAKGEVSGRKLDRVRGVRSDDLDQQRCGRGADIPQRRDYRAVNVVDRKRGPRRLHVVVRGQRDQKRIRDERVSARYCVYRVRRDANRDGQRRKRRASLPAYR